MQRRGIISHQHESIQTSEQYENGDNLCHCH